MMEIALAKEKSKCCGCGTCALVCSANAIHMVSKELGCVYPEIDSEKCIHCHACEMACAYANRTEQRPKMGPRVFAAAAKNNALLKKSASGGVFAALAYSIINAGGIVYGCSLEMENGFLTPKHIGVETPEDIRKLQGSKYVQSALGGVFAQVKRALKDQRTVLFSGTPCQVDALHRYLRGTSRENLFTVDIICHGVPGAELFQEYLCRLEKKERGRITAFSFRDKTKGWGLNACYSVRRSNGTENVKSIPSGISSYYSFFLESETYRESCYSCRYANTSRVGDITIGDFWGIEQEHPELLEENGGVLNTFRGVSAVLVNSPMGEQLLSQYGQDIDIAKSSLEKVVKWNRQLREPSSPSFLRQKLTDAYLLEGYVGVERMFRKKLGIRYPVRKMKQWYAERMEHSWINGRVY